MTKCLPPGLTDCFLWSEELGLGWHPRDPMDYTGSYFANYQRLDATPMGAALTKARVDLVRKHHDGVVVDIGIGGGRFVTECDALGYDVSAEAMDWLADSGRAFDPYSRLVPAISCWDSLEHIPDPEALLRQVTHWLFVSMPIYTDMLACIGSKHYKPGEHIWYWSLPGFVNWCERQGFRLVEMNQAESELGREGITSFAFRRHG